MLNKDEFTCKVNLSSTIFRNMFPRSCHIAEQQIVICIFDYNKIVVHSNYFIHSKCSKLTSKFYKSQVGRECCVRNTEVCINNFSFLSLYVHHANRKISNDNFHYCFDSMPTQKKLRLYQDDLPKFYKQSGSRKR